jgi:glycosyltransferase involved in cell wall biosynthesis
MTSPVVSILMPVFNGAAYVGRAIESALAQTYPDFELIIVNDGSTDNSAEVIRPYLADPRIRYLAQPNGGVAAARNAAIRVAQGRYIGFLDQDDLWLPEKLRLQVQYLDEHPDVGLVHAVQSYIDSDGRHTRLSFDDGFAKVSGWCFKDLFIRNRIAVLTVLARKSVLDSIGPLNETIPGGDDYEMWLRISKHFPIGHLDQVLAHYRTHESNVSNDYFRMTRTDLGAIQSILQRYPEARRELGSRVVDARLFELNYQLGGWYMWKAQDCYRAKGYYWQAIRSRPRCLKCYWRLAWCCLNNSQRRMLGWYWHRLKTALRIAPPT